MSDWLIIYGAGAFVFAALVTFCAFLTNEKAEDAWATALGGWILSPIWPLGVCVIAGSICRSRLQRNSSPSP